MQNGVSGTTTVRQRSGPVLSITHTTAPASPLRLDGPDPLCPSDLTLLPALQTLGLDTRMHCRRVCQLAGRLASALGLPRAARGRAATAGLLHDIGKSLVPEFILHKPTALSADEKRVLRLHPIDGEALASFTGDPVVLDAIRHHHERLDGTGYPDGLSGDGLSEVTRVVAVVDVYDALTSDRPYRPALCVAEAVGRMTDVAGTKLDPEMVEALVLLQAGARSRAA